MTALVSEMTASTSGYRLVAQAVAVDGRAMIRLSSTAKGYGFPGRAPIVFEVDVEPGARSVRLRGARYASGLSLREGAHADYAGHLLPIARAFEARHPEVFLHPAIGVRRAMGEKVSPLTLDTGIGDMDASFVDGRWIVEMLTISGNRGALRRKREILGVVRDRRVEAIHVWSSDPHGRRIAVDADINEKWVFSGIARSAPVEEAGAWVENGPDLGAAVDRAYADLEPVDAVLDERWGGATVRELVSRVNAQRARIGSPPIPMGSFPTNMIKLRAFLHLAEAELRLA